jgi:glycerol-3-phosphate cytidylyltransferase
MFKNGITFGAFDLCHTGHVLFLNACRKYCENLTVGLHIDPSIERPEKHKPIQSVFERYVGLQSLHAVDYVIPYEKELDIELILQYGEFDGRFLSEEYRDKEITGKRICFMQDIELFFIPRNHNFSSSELRSRIIDQTRS